MDKVAGFAQRFAKDPRGEIGTAAFVLAVVFAGWRHMFFSKDKKWPKQPDAGSLEGHQVQEVTIVFVRHGESEWNDIFNKGFKPSFLVRLLVGLVREAMKLFSSDSVFIDSPLSAEGAPRRKGIAQARALALYFAAPVGESPQERALKDLLKRSPGAPPSVVVSSNLRRALVTGAVALSERLRRTKEPILVLSSLQEITVNIDSLSMTPARTAPDIPGIGVSFDSTGHKGNKTVKSNGAIRMREFADWAFARPQREAVIAVGHSLWFRSFFDVYLPRGADAVARKRKLTNCSVAAFTLQRGVVAGQVVYRIAPQSLTVLYGGFM